jgi:hypothetical protein
MAGQSVSTRPAVAQPERNPRMQQTEKELQYTGMEHSSQESVPERNRAKAVTMPKAERLSGDLDN